jgi:hypothetical protein
MIWVRYRNSRSFAINPRFVELADRFTHLATIEWHTLDNSKLIYQGSEVTMGKFMPSDGPFGL